MNYKFVKILYKVLVFFAPKVTKKFIEKMYQIFTNKIVGFDLKHSEIEYLQERIKLYRKIENLCDESITVEFIITVYNRGDLAIKCARSVMEEITRSNFSKNSRVLFADDNSALPTKKILIDFSAQNDIEYLCNEENLGVIKNINKHYEKSDADIVVVLNSDVIITPGSLDSLISPFLKDKLVALVTLPTFDDFVSEVGYAPFANYTEINKFLREKSEIIVVESHPAVSYCMAVNKKLIDFKPLLDISYGKGYGEESDLHFRIREKGFKSVWSLGNCVIHEGGKSFGSSEKINFEKKKNDQFFNMRWGQRYILELPRNNYVNSYAYRMTVQGYNLKFTNRKKGVIIPKINSKIGGLMIAEQFLKENQIDVVYSIRDDENKSLANRYKNLPLEEVLNCDQIYLFGDESIEVIKSHIERLQDTEVNFIYQGYDYLINPRSFDLYDRYLKNFSNIFVNSNEIGETLVYFNLGNKPNIHSFSIEMDYAKFSGEVLEFENRIYDVCLLLRSEHGKGGWLASSLAQYLRKLNYKVLVIFNGQLSDDQISEFKSLNIDLELNPENSKLLDLLNETRVFIDTSLYEGYGLLPREAFLKGCHVIFSSFGPIRKFADGLRMIYNPDFLELSSYARIMREIMATKHKFVTSEELNNKYESMKD
jgi:GT2 family glycosyltransferase